MSGRVVTTDFRIFEPLERLSIFTPLGIRFWDAALDRQVRDGLVVTARRAGAGQRSVRAFTTRLGIYAFRGLPGMRAIEHPVSDDAPEGSPPNLASFIIEVTDALGRFVPTVFEVAVPFSGVFPTGAGGPDAPPGVYLFSAPARPVVSNVVVLRAQLAEQDEDGNQQPADFALLEVEVAGQPAVLGIADTQGRVAVQFPYPRFTTAISAGSPPAGATSPPNQHWEATVRVRFDPDALDFPAGSEVPDLGTIFSQRQGRFEAGVGLPSDQSVAEYVTEIAFGRECVLRHPPGSTLLIRRAV